MQAVVAELANGAGGDENLSGSDSESSDSENDEKGEEGEWEDVVEEDKILAKRNKKILSCVDKVRHS